jgi:hypothetical protein
MNVDILAGLRAATEFSLKSPFFESYGQGPGAKECLLVNAIESGDIYPADILGQRTVAIYTLIAAGDNALKVSGKNSVLQLVEHTGLQSG